VCTAKQILPSEIKFSIQVIIVVVYVFNSFHMVTVVHIRGSCFDSMFNILSSVECVVALVI
jgi:hypothetical protein